MSAELPSSACFGQHAACSAGGAVTAAPAVSLMLNTACPAGGAVTGIKCIKFRITDFLSLTRINVRHNKKMMLRFTVSPKLLSPFLYTPLEGRVHGTRRAEGVYMERGMRRACTWNAACGGSNAHLRRRAPYNPVFRGKAAKKHLSLEAGLTAAFSPSGVTAAVPGAAARGLRPGGLRHCIFPEILLQ